MHIKKIKGSVFIFISSLLFGSYGVWAVLVGTDFGVFFQGYVRSLIILAILVPIAIYTKQWLPISKDDMKKYAWCCGFGIFTQAPLYYAFQHAGIGISSLMFFSAYAVSLYIFGYLFLEERISKIKMISLILAIIGLLFVFGVSFKIVSVLALLLAVINGIASGGEVSLTKIIPKKFSALQTTIMIWGAIFITHLPLSFIFNEKQIIPTFDIHWLAMLGFTACGAIAFFLVIEGFKHVDASIGGLIGLLEVVFAIIFGALVFHEVINISIILGAALIISAAALPHIKTRN